MTPGPDSLSVVICAYTDERWSDLQAAVASVRGQVVPADEIVVVIDHNPDLLARARAGLEGVTVVPNAQARGLSGGRNTGIAASRGAVVAFLDDDATAAPDWTARLLAPYADPDVLGVGGRVVPRFDADRPRWLPEEFDWVVGCTYTGHRPDPGPVRNVIGANMSVRRDVFDEIGGFRHSLGRTAAVPAGCEETELFIRAGQRFPTGIVWYEPTAVVSHRVPAGRTTTKYFRSRCYAEGISKTQISRLVGSRDGLASERAYATRALPRAVARELRGAARGDRHGFARAGMLVAGMGTTAAGFARARVGAVRADRRPDADESGFRPAWVVTVDAADPPVDLVPPTAEDGRTYPRALVVLRDHGTPLGVVELDVAPEGIPAAALDELLTTTLGETAGPAPAPGLERIEVRERPPTAVVIATRDRVDLLEHCLDSIRRLDEAPARVVVVDNHSTSPDTMAMVERLGRDDPRFVAVREERPGVAHAHNRALALVREPLVAFTDDDVVVDARWLSSLVDAFGREPDAGCVTGMILPFELETAAQQWLESYAGFNKGFRVEVFDAARRAVDPLFPYAAGAFGSGANMAFRTDLLAEIGGFDPALGAGTTAKGGDDLAAFFDVIASGHSIVYEPGAIIFHRHHRTFAALERQTYGYGAGLTAYLTKTIVDRPARALDMLVRVPRALRHGLSPDSAKNARLPDTTPRGLVWRERAGMLAGPPLYLASRWQARAVARPTVPAPPVVQSSPAVDPPATVRVRQPRMIRAYRPAPRGARSGGSR